MASEIVILSRDVDNSFRISMEHSGPPFNDIFVRESKSNATIQYMVNLWLKDPEKDPYNKNRDLIPGIYHMKSRFHLTPRELREVILKTDKFIGAVIRSVNSNLSTYEEIASIRYVIDKDSVKNKLLIIFTIKFANNTTTTVRG